MYSKSTVTVLVVVAIGAISSIVHAGQWEAESLASPAKMVADPAASGGKARVISDSVEEAYLLKEHLLHLPQPGKYRLVVRMKVERPGHLGTPIVAKVLQGERLIGWAVWFGASFSEPSYRDLSVAFEARGSKPVRFTLGWRPVTNMHYHEHRYLSIRSRRKPTVSVVRGDLGRVFLDRVSLVARNRTVGISQLKCKKIHLRRGETQSCEVLVSNYTGSPQELDLTLKVITKIDEVRPLRSWSLALAPGGSRTLEHSWSVGQQEYGRQVRAILMRGDEVLDRQEEYFGVSDNIWKLGIRARHHRYYRPGQYGFILPDPPEPVVNYIHWTGLCTPELIEKWLRTHIDGTYVNVIEKFSWAPDFFSDMTPEQERWRSGQGTYYESKSMLKLTIQKAHERGVKVTTYGYGWAGGPPGYEYARRHPELVCYNHDGTLWAGVFNTKWFEDWPHLTPDDYYHVWPRIRVNFAHPEVLETAIRELKGSIEMFGWDGVRFDSHAYYVWARRPDLSGKLVPSEEVDLDALSAQNVRKTKHVIRADYPDFAFGYNWGPIYRKRGARYPKNYAACLEGGGMRLNEQVIEAHEPDRPGHVWQEYADVYARDASHAISLGGHYWVMQLRRGGRMDILHQAALSLAARCHLYNSSLGPTVFGNLARFVTRYSYYIWDPELEPVEEPDELFAVEADRPPIWRPFVYRRSTPEGAQIVMHLVNRPPFEAIGDNTEELAPPPQDVGIRLLDPSLAGRIRRATLLCPQSAGEPEQLEAAEDLLEVEKLRLWKVLVLELG